MPGGRPDAAPSPPTQYKLVAVRPSTPLRAGDAPPNTLLGRWLVAAGCLSAAAVLFTGQVRADYWYAGRELSWGRALAVSLAAWEPWAVLAPGVLALAVRVPIARPRLIRALSVHVPAGALFAFVAVGLDVGLTRAITGSGRIPSGAGKVYLSALTYWAIVAGVQWAEQRRLSQARELRASQLETELARAQVDALKMQLHPHFLFNTLNAISGLMREDVDAADVMLAQLSDLLRRTLDTDGRYEVPLGDEIQWLRAYLAIQQTRFGDRLEVRIDVAPGCQSALVPTLILQPIVENAIRHGFSAQTGPGRLTIAAERAGERLRIDVTDDGPGAPEPVREGYGLRNTRSRLRALHADSAALVVERRSAGRGTLSRIELPFRTETPA
jgi:two-component system LytT family sensor kinase